MKVQRSGTTGFNELLGLELKGVSDSEYRLELEIGDRHLNDAGGVHGGVYLSLLDTVLARACRIDQAETAYWPTLEMKVNFLRSVGAGRVEARGRVVKRGRRICYGEAELIAANGKLLARASATMIFIDRDAAQRSPERHQVASPEEDSRHGNA